MIITRTQLWDILYEALEDNYNKRLERDSDDFRITIITIGVSGPSSNPSLDLKFDVESGQPGHVTTHERFNLYIQAET